MQPSGVSPIRPWSGALNSPCSRDCGRSLLLPKKAHFEPCRCRPGSGPGGHDCIDQYRNQDQHDSHTDEPAWMDAFPLELTLMLLLLFLLVLSFLLMMLMVLFLVIHCFSPG